MSPPLSFRLTCWTSQLVPNLNLLSPVPSAPLPVPLSPVAPSSSFLSVSWLGLPAWSRVLQCSQVCTGMAPNRPALGWSFPRPSLLVSITLLAAECKQLKQEKESRGVGASWYPSEDILTCQCWFLSLLLSQTLPECTWRSPWTPLCITAHIQTIPCSVYLTFHMDLKLTLDLLSL